MFGVGWDWIGDVVGCFDCEKGMVEDVELVKFGGESVGGLEGCDSFGLGVYL